MLFDLRSKIGELLGWDKPDAGSAPGCRRCATDCRPICATHLPGPGPDDPQFRPVYLTDDEFAAESANQTVHGVMHLGWVPDGTGGYRGQLAVLVKPNGLLGKAYMAAIAPFRYLIVYPWLMRDLEEQWRALDRDPAPRAGRPLVS